MNNKKRELKKSKDSVLCLSNKGLKKYIALIISSIFAALLPAMAVIATEKIILTTVMLSPYQEWGANKQLTGIAVEPIRCALDLMEQPYEFQVFPWKRAQLLVKEKKAHGFFIASKNVRRDNYATASIPIIQNKWLWYALVEKEIDMLSPDFNSSMSVASIEGTNMLFWLEKEFTNVYSLKNTKKLFLMLDKARVDVALINQDMFNSEIHPNERKKYKSFFSKDRPLRAYFEKEFLSMHSGFLNKFNLSVEECLKL